ncbi:MAG: hypothetical protein KJ808_04295 [Acidobacteria bacterium]|nr:hypothetical protein [Acidobacteriota bacterium]MBU4306378.1 hypothetical protein [Acidobacteriota bacterium]MCG2810170.1 hypothetical protein [Candidatus Aminicenantes bacterium]
MLAFLRFERRRLFGEKKNLIFLGFISLFSAYFVWSGLNEQRQFQAEKKIFINFEKEKFSQFVTYAQYGGFGFRLLYEASPLNLFFVNSSVLQDVESNIDGLETIKVESSFKGNKLFLKRGYFKDFAGIPFIFGSLFMLYLGHLALVSPAYLRFMTGRMALKKYYALTTAARLFWLDLFFVSLGLGLFFLVQLGGVAFSGSEKKIFLSYLLFLVLLLNFFYLLGQLTSVLVRFRKVFFLWFFIIWFICIFLLPESNRISVFNKSRVLESAEKVNLEKFRTLMALEKKFRDYLKVNPAAPLDQIRQMQKKFAVQFINNSFLLNTGLETKYLRDVEKVIASHERQSVLFPTTFYHFLSGEASGKGYYGYLDFMDYIIGLRNRFMQFYLKNRYEGNEATVESFVKNDENIFRSRSRLPKTFWFGLLVTVFYGAVFLVLAYWLLRRQVFQP